MDIPPHQIPQWPITRLSTKPYQIPQWPITRLSMKPHQIPQWPITKLSATLNIVKLFLSFAKLRICKTNQGEKKFRL